ncbi:MAG: hypothetical protein F8N15_07645 [Methanobacterium sp.]|nr:hypothetical protein [Methanobacterium sp.]
MSGYPLYVTVVMLMLVGMVQSSLRFPIEIAKRYAALINPMMACHTALIRYSELNPAASGKVSSALVDAELPPGVVDPGSFTYVIAVPGTVTTYLTVPAAGQSIAIAALQKLTDGSVVAGPIVDGDIIPPLPLQPLPAPGIPNGAIAIQTIVRNK